MALVLAGVEGPVDLVSVDVDQGAVEDDERGAGAFRVLQGVPDPWCAGGEQADGLAGAPPGGRRSDAEPGCEIPQRFAFSQVGEGE